MPAALTYNLAKNKYSWCHNTKAQRHLNNRRPSWPWICVLRGSSSMNAMVYIRGHAKDYNDWEKSGATGWNYPDCLPYFRKSQSHSLGANAYRGGWGPIHVTRGNQKNQILFQKFIEAAMQADYPLTDDMNGYNQEGFAGWIWPSTKDVVGVLRRRSFGLLSNVQIWSHHQYNDHKNRVSRSSSHRN